MESTADSGRYSDLEQRLNQPFPESWVPQEAGDTIAGQFVRLDGGQTNYGPAKIAVLRTEDGRERGVWLLHTVLKSEIKRLRPEPGEAIAIRYDGRKTGASGQTYEGYRVVADRSRAASWDDLDVEADPRGEPALATAATDGGQPADDDIPF